MHHASAKRLVLALALGGASLAGSSVLFACADNETGTLPGSDAGPDGKAAKDGATDEPAEAGTDVEEAPIDGPGEEGAECFFNQDCRASLRCECVNEECACKPGVRGKGKNGVDKCESESDCASAICVDDSNDGKLCSDECDSDGDCPPKLPRCLSLFGGPSFCSRLPPGN